MPPSSPLRLAVLPPAAGERTSAETIEQPDKSLMNCRTVGKEGVNYSLFLLRDLPERRLVDFLCTALA